MKDFLWWRDGIVYQIYPRSFADSTNDGLGDLPGITSKLDYLADLGVDALWLSPIYPSPDKDFGYDVSNYVDIDPRYGSLADFDRLLSEAHRRNVRIILDLVLNHTSDEHAWFLESRSSRDNPKADWYIWSPPQGNGKGAGKKAGPPNNWQSVFGGPAWTYVPERDQHYFHMFDPGQPDLNWRNPDVRAAVLDSVRFWLERGVDGFRLDVFNVYFKDEQLRDNPPKVGIRSFDRQFHIYDCDQPEMISMLKELRSILDEYPERYSVGETFISKKDKISLYCGMDRLHAAFNFEFTWSKFDPAKYARHIQAWEDLYTRHGIWPNYVLGNHDVPRMASRHTRSEKDARLKILMTMLLTLRGTPYLYYGEEIGMRNISVRRDQIMDPPGKKFWPFYKGRDGYRSPMQWDDSKYAGFSSVQPWLPAHPNYQERNVEHQSADPDSLLNFTKNIIELRREKYALHHGDFKLLTPQPIDSLSYLRQGEDHRFLVTLNFKDRRINVPEIPEGKWKVQISTYRENGADISTGSSGLQLAPYEASIFEYA